MKGDNLVPKPGDRVERIEEPGQYGYVIESNRTIGKRGYGNCIIRWDNDFDGMEKVNALHLRVVRYAVAESAAKPYVRRARGRTPDDLDFYGGNTDMAFDGALDAGISEPVFVQQVAPIARQAAVTVLDNIPDNSEAAEVLRMLGIFELAKEN